ncbi:glycosyltransferase family 2 protein [Alteromonas sp. ASW11-130]|uniref:glycosyltransferase family 2 protein n=1 Tax=Alteromonas sp. ASW11-130 TaxID=3015775 RepID=UPI00224259DD|nr:glycosyltransferase family 2 protein [Alteromonas sp. ASW11-130]MCW8091692.1 glycosyltransferase family 2 protein [Alteromonas sp. ASW11-130]
MIDVLVSCDIHTVLVDNSSKPYSGPLSTRVNYLHYPENVGIAAAQNAGLIELKKCNFDAAFIFDQDSDLTKELIYGLLTHLQNGKNPKEQKVAAIGPVIVCGFTETHQIPKFKKSYPKDKLFEVDQIIASGMLINLLYLEDIGLKDESLFIDGVDHEWCWRARSKGFSILMASDVPMFHKQGDARHKYFGLTFKRGAPIRLYYQVRNVLKLSRHSHVPLRWKLRQLMALPIRWLVNRFFFPEGQLRGRFMKKGFYDGLKNRSGKIKP